jgi:arylsulfatase
MKRNSFSIIALLSVFLFHAANADVVEIKLVDAQDETRGWCVDLFAHLTNAMPLGGFQGHDCFLYFGSGPQIDQGFDEELIAESRFRLPYWDVCMTLQERKHHSYVAAEPCSDDSAQEITMHDDGRITPDTAPELCLTIGSITIPGGGRLAPVGARPPADNSDIPQIRRMTFDTCSDEPSIAVRQIWTTRKGEFAPEERSMPHRFMQTTADNRPNILFIVADDLGFTDLGSFGSEISTPTLDELALGGLRIANMHAGPACQQTRAMLMASTGYARAIENRPQLEGGQRDNLLSRDWAIIPELLQEAGYATYATGKWDLGWHEGYTPATRGFDRSFVQLGASSSFFREIFLQPFGLGFEDDGVRVEFEDLDEDFYATDHYTDKMIEYLREAEEGKPWFAFMPYTAPHWPLQLPDDWLDKYAGQYEMGYDELRQQRFRRAIDLGVLPDNASLENFDALAEPWADLSADEQRKYSRAQEIYAGMVEHLDMSIARVINVLKESGQLENTVIVFTSDHGASGSEHGVDTGRVPQGGRGPTVPEHTDNSLENFGRINSFIDHGRGFGEAATAPFRYQKGSVNEGGVRAAGFIYYPAEVAAGGISHTYMTMMDFLPTFMEIAGAEHPGAGTFRGREIKDILGRSAWSHLTGQADTVHDDNYSVGWSNGSSGSLIRGDFKLINTSPPGERGTTEWRLYNLVNDPGEHRDIAADHPEMVAEMVDGWETNWR